MVQHINLGEYKHSFHNTHTHTHARVHVCTYVHTMRERESGKKGRKRFLEVGKE